MSESPLLPIVLLVAAAVVLRLFSWRAVLFLRPEAVRVEAETPADVTTVPGALEPAWEALRALGFVLLGSHVERVPFAPSVTMFDASHPTAAVTASLFLGPDGKPRLVLLTRSAQGFVITADHPRPSREVPGRYLSGGLEGASPERLLKVHLRRAPEVGAAIPLVTLDSRVDAARAWFCGSGKPELRQQHAVALLWTLGALGMVCAAAYRLLH